MQPLDQVIVSGAFDSPAAVEAFFRRLHAEGTVLSMSGDVDYHGQPRGAPELRRAADGFLFPRKAAVQYEREGHTFRLVFDKMGRDTTVRVLGPASCLELMESFFAQQSARASVFIRGLAASTLARIHERLGGTPQEDFRIRLEEQGLLVPDKLRLETELDGHRVMVEFFSHPGGETDLIIHCPAPHYHALARTLQRLVDEAQEARVQSLDGELDVRGYSWARVGGLDEVAQQLRDWIELPLRNPLAFERLGLRPPKGVLLSGPPGTGKTTLAKVLACESGAAFFSISPGDTSSMYYGETERNIRRIFARAREYPRAILFVDEIDGFFRSREGPLHEASGRALAQIMTEMDGLSDARGVVVLGATNRPEALDAALRRPGRFDHHVELALPGLDARRAILAIHLSGKPGGQLDLLELAERSEGMSGAELELWCNSATYHAWKRVASERQRDPADLTELELREVQLTREDFQEQ